MRSKLAAIALLLVVVALFWWRHGAGGSAREAIASKGAAAGFETAVDGAHERKPDRRPPVEPVPNPPRSEALAAYSPEAETAFYQGASDLAEHYRNAKLPDFYTHLRGVLNGNGHDLDLIFTTYRAEPEGYGSYLARLRNEVGDAFFAYHLARQDEATQRLVFLNLHEHQDAADLPSPQTDALRKRLFPPSIRTSHNE